jgi:hypothetical protein
MKPVKANWLQCWFFFFFSFFLSFILFFMLEPLACQAIALPLSYTPNQASMFFHNGFR